MVIAQNKKAYHDYFILETFEAGIALKGYEVKSIRSGHISIKEAHARIKNGRSVELINMYIKEYQYATQFQLDETRTRQLLMHKKEIVKLDHKIKTERLTLIPLKVYTTRGLVKIQLGLGKGKKNHDKREDLAKKDAKRSMERTLKEYR
jgi:SsrA-binding protein